MTPIPQTDEQKLDEMHLNWIKENFDAELKALDLYLNELLGPNSPRDGGHTAIAFTDKWRAFKKAISRIAASAIHIPEPVNNEARHPKVTAFANAMQDELTANQRNGYWEVWRNVNQMLSEFDHHKEKLLKALMDDKKGSVKEYLADCGNILMFIGNAGGLYDNAQSHPSTLPVKDESEPFFIRYFNPKEWYWCKCKNCDWEDSSEFAAGGEAIADTGDFNDPCCPICYSKEIDGEETVIVPDGSSPVLIQIPYSTAINPYKKHIEQITEELEKYRWPAPSPLPKEDIVRDNQTIYTYYHLELVNMSEPWNETICETLEQVDGMLRYLDMHLDDATPTDDGQARKVILTGIPMTPPGFDKWKKEHSF